MTISSHEECIRRRVDLQREKFTAHVGAVVAVAREDLILQIEAESVRHLGAALAAGDTPPMKLRGLRDLIDSGELSA